MMRPTPRIVYTVAGISLFILWMTFVTSITLNTHNRVLALERKQETMETLYQMTLWEIVRRESISLTPYYCPSGHRTIGIGTRTRSLDTMTLQQAQDSMETHFQRIYEIARREFPGHTYNELLAISLLAYNTGVHTLRARGQWERIKHRHPDLLEKWGQYVYYRSSGRWHKSANLVKARRFEVALYTGDLEYLGSIRAELRAQAMDKYSRAAGK